MLSLFYESEISYLWFVYALLTSIGAVDSFRSSSTRFCNAWLEAFVFCVTLFGTYETKILLLLVSFFSALRFLFLWLSCFYFSFLFLSSLRFEIWTTSMMEYLKSPEEEKKKRWRSADNKYAPYIYIYIYVCVSFSLLESELSACKHLHAYSDLKRSFSVIFVRRSIVGVSEVRRTKRALPSTFSSNVAKTKGKGKKGGGSIVIELKKKKKKKNSVRDH